MQKQHGEIFFKGWFVFLFLLGAIFILYAPALNNEFTNWDDQEYVLKNTAIQELSMQSISNMFSNFILISYHPLTLLSIAINYYFSGNEAFGYIFTNILFHVLNSFLVFRLIHKINFTKQVAFIAALLFAIHPIHVESVAWIAERKDVLFSFFFLLSLSSYVSYYKTKEKVLYLFAFIFFVFSCLSKAQAVTLSVVLFLIDYLFEGKFSVKSIKNKIPFLAGSIFFGWLNTQAQGLNASAFAGSEFTFLQRVAFAADNFVRYLFDTLFPINLVAFNPYPENFNSTMYLRIAAVLLAVSLLIYFKRKNKVFMFSLLFYSITIFFLLQLFPVGDALRADHYMYLPSIGIFLLLAYYFDVLIAKTPKRKIVYASIGLVYCLFLGKTAMARNDVWQNGITLWNDVLKNYSESSLAYVNRGSNYYEKGDTAKALSDFTDAIKYDKENDFAKYNVATIYFQSGDFASSLAALNQMDSTKLNNIDAFLIRAYCENKTGDFASSQRSIQKYLSVKEDAESLTLAGLNLIMTGDYRNAKEYLDRAIQKDSEYVEAFVKRGVAQIQLSDTAGACQSWGDAVNLGNTDVLPFIKQYCK